MLSDLRWIQSVIIQWTIHCIHHIWILLSLPKLPSLHGIHRVRVSTSLLCWNLSCLPIGWREELAGWPQPLDSHHTCGAGLKYTEGQTREWRGGVGNGGRVSTEGGEAAAKKRGGGRQQWEGRLRRGGIAHLCIPQACVKFVLSLRSKQMPQTATLNKVKVHLIQHPAICFEISE